MARTNLIGCFKVAQDVVRTAGPIAEKARRRCQIRRHKEDGDLVTNGDLAVEKHILGHLMERFPDHGYYSEERGELRADADYVWILDPIDGTKYFAGGMPLYAISLALRHRNELVLGVVYAPALNNLYAACRGRGSTLNGRQLKWSPKTKLADATLCVDIPSHSAPAAQRMLALRRLGNLVAHSFRVRIFGVSSLGLCFCASGGFDAYLHLGTNFDTVDYAGGWVVAREAGAKVAMVGPHLLAASGSLGRQVRAAAGL